MDSLEKLSLRGIRIDDLLPSVGEQCPNLVSLVLRFCYYSLGIEVNLDALKHLNELELYVYEAKKISGVRRWFNDFFGVNGEYYTKILSLPSQLRWNIRKLNMSLMNLDDGKMPSGIGEMYNLEELDLSLNFVLTKLGFALSQLTRLKMLDISWTGLVELPKLPSSLIVLDISDTPLVELPKLPSSLIVLKANGCNRLTITVDSFMNCKRLCQVSLKEVRIISDCSELLESMLQGINAMESHYMRLTIDAGIEIAKQKTILPLLIRGDRCRLKLTENWHKDYSGFLMCAVVNKYDYTYFNYVTMKQVTRGMEFDDDYKRTIIWYVSFASIRHTTWWNSIDKTPVSVSFEFEPNRCRGFGVKMVYSKSRSGATETSTTQEESEFSLYTPKFYIRQDSRYLLKISNI